MTKKEIITTVLLFLIFSPIFLIHLIGVIPISTANAFRESSTSYYALQRNAGYMILQGTAGQWDENALHSFSIVELNLGGYKYWGYYGGTYDQGIGLARTNDLQSPWRKYGLINASLRSASVIKIGTTIHMFAVKDYNTTGGATTTLAYIIRQTSTNGIDFTWVQNVTTPDNTGWRTQDPSIWFNPNDGKYYLYYTRVEITTNRIQIRVKSSSDITTLDTASSTVIFDTTTDVIGNPNMHYDSNDKLYWLLLDRMVNANPSYWQIDAYYSSYPDSGFTKSSDSPIVPDSASNPYQYTDSDTGTFFLYFSFETNWANFYWELRVLPLKDGDSSNQGYMALGTEYRILWATQAWEGGSVHTASIIEKNLYGYKYWMYYGSTYDQGIGMAFANSLFQLGWDKLVFNPINTSLRWATVWMDSSGGVHMFATKDYGTGNIELAYIIRQYSVDGYANFAWVENVTQPETGWRTQNSFIWQNPNDGKFYLYYLRKQIGTNRHQVMVRVSNDITTLDTTNEIYTIFDENYIIAAPSMKYQNGYYWLTVEVYEDDYKGDDTWKTRAYYSTSPTGGFIQSNDGAILSFRRACFFQHTLENVEGQSLFGIYSYEIDPSTFTWDIRLRGMFPVNLDVTITNSENIDGERWVFAEEKYYNFEAKYMHSRGDLDTVKIAFSDGYTWVNASYDVIGDNWYLDSGANIVTLEEGDVVTLSNNFTVTFHIFIRESVVDALDIDIYLWSNDTDGNEEGWILVQSDYFNIYSRGGWGELFSSGDAGRRVGGDIFELYANASSWAKANATYRWLQWVHMEFAVEDPSFTDLATAGQYHYQEWNVTFGIYYSYGGQWIRGWEVVLDIVGSATYDDANDFNVVRARWYWKGVLKQTNYMSILWEGSVGTINFREPPVFRFWLDLWFNKINGSRVVGGRLTPYYFGVRRQATGESDIWGAFFNMYGGTPWQPNYPSAGQEGVVTASMFWHQLEDASGNIITARELELMKIWGGIERSVNFTYEVALCEFRTFDIKTATGKMDGIDTPVFEESKMASLPILGGRLAFLGNIIGGVINWVFSVLYHVADWTINAVDSFIYIVTGKTGVMRGLVNLVTPLFEHVTTFGSWVSNNFTNIMTFLVQIITFISGMFTNIIDFITWFVSNTLTPFLSAIGEIRDFFAGTGRYSEASAMVSTMMTIGMYLAPLMYLGRMARGGFRVIKDDLQMLWSLKDLLISIVEFGIRIANFLWAIIGRIIQLIRG